MNVVHSLLNKIGELMIVLMDAARVFFGCVDTIWVGKKRIVFGVMDAAVGKVLVARKGEIVLKALTSNHESIFLGFAVDKRARFGGEGSDRDFAQNLSKARTADTQFGVLDVKLNKGRSNEF